MMLARACRLGISPTIAGILKTSTVQKITLPRIENIRLFANEGRGAFTRSARLKEAAVSKGKTFSPESAYHVGASVVAGGALVGLGALCYYGMGLSSAPGAADKAMLWPQYVRDRIQSSYTYLGGSMLVSVASASMALRSPTVMRFVSQGGLMSFIACVGLLMGTGIAATRIPYEKGFNGKHLAWLAHSGAVGVIVAPLYALGGPILLRAACYTAGVVLSLSAIAVCAPSDKFLNMAAPLGIGLGVVFASCIASSFLPPTTMIGASMHSIAFYGGLVLFSLLLLYDTQKLIKKAEMTPMYNGISEHAFDPIRCSIDVYMDIVNIFMRVAMMMGGSRKK